MSKLNVLYLTDNNYATYAGVSITSLFENNKHIDDITVYLIDDNISNDNKVKYNELGSQYNREIIFLDVSKGIERLKELGAPLYRNSYTTYLKLFAFNLLPDSVHRIFFIDSDSIITGGLEEMITFDLKGNVIGAVRDGMSHTYKCMLGFPPESSWFNMGVMLVDVDMWKKNNCQADIERQLKKRSAYVAVDQDLLNITQNGKIATLSPRYNATPHHYVYREKDFMKAFPQEGFYDEATLQSAQESAVIRHFERFVGESPWHKNSIHPYTFLFDEYLAISPWKEYEKKKPTKNLTLKIEKILYLCLPKKVFVRLFAAGFRRYLYNCNKKFSSDTQIANVE